MSIDFDQFKKDNVLETNHTFNEEEVTELLEYLGSHPEINTLNLSDSDNNDQLLQSLANCNNLTSLNVSTCYEITDKGLEHLSKLTNLTSLNVSDNNITDEGLSHLSELKKLTNLDVSECHGITLYSIVKIASNRPDLAIKSDYNELFEKVHKVEIIRKDNNDLELKQAVKEMVFNLAQNGGSSEAMIYTLLNNPEKYPFLVNSKEPELPVRWEQIKHLKESKKR